MISVSLVARKPTDWLGRRGSGDPRRPTRNRLAKGDSV